MRSTRARARGFTLIELMIVVAIVGVLAILATVGYRAIINSARSTEARQVLGSIRIAQEARRAEVGTYADVSPAYANLCPTNAGTDDRKRPWDPACGAAGVNAGWAALSLRVDGPVRYGYSTRAGAAGTTPDAVPGQAADFPNVTWPLATGPWYVAYAELNSNGDTVVSRAVASSFTNEIWTANENE